MQVEIKNMVDHTEKIKLIDTNTFERLFTTHYDALYRYCQTMLKEQKDIEDITQSVFMDLWNEHKKVVIHTSVKAYLFKAVYFKCMNKLKHDKVIAKHISTLPNTEKSFNTDSMITEEISVKIKETLDSLPEQCRKIFNMSRLEGLKYQEIAEILQLSVKTVENQMGKALKTMRIALSEYINIIATTTLIYLQ